MSLIVLLRTSMTRLGMAAGHPLAFLFVCLYGVVWFYRSPETLDWGGAATLATWLMTVLIQRATHRDTQAIHAKLDELLHTSTLARSSLANIDTKELEEIISHRQSAGQPE